MTAAYRVLGADALAPLRDPARDFAHDVLVGLSERPKRLSSKYFYDDEGSRLFQRIMALEAYYLTRAEREILERHGDAIVASLGSEPLNLVDLGAGDGAKTMVLIEKLTQAGVDFVYVPIDISEEAMRLLSEEIARRAPGARMEGLVCEYTDGVRWLSSERAERHNFVLFLGSNIGNFSLPQARGFLRRLWSVLRAGDHALVGFDLKKDIEALLDAYNDPSGVTADFNLNLLTRMNRELGANFKLDAFRHFGTYNVFSGAMESYLVSQEAQVVHIGALEQSFAFDAWEPVHTEYSYKYLRADIDALARETGFSLVERYEDERGYFADALFEVGARSVPTPRA